MNVLMVVFGNYSHPGPIMCFSGNQNITDNASIWQKVFHSPGSHSTKQNNSINLIIDEIDINRETVGLVDSNRVTCYTKTNSFPLNSSMVDYNVAKERNNSLPQFKYCEEG